MRAFGSVRKTPSNGYTLEEAADRARLTAEREQLALLDVARRAPEGADAWFAQSITGILKLCSRAPDRDQLRLSAADLDIYFAWLRSVQ